MDVKRKLITAPRLKPVSYTHLDVYKRQVLSCRTPGAGGYGDPSKRDRNLIIRDLEQGFITPQCAKKDYGLTDEEIHQIHLYEMN